MKGTPQFVMCGNSQRALDALRRAGAPVTAVDILPNPQIRQELSALSGWPTIPQGFVRGELICVASLEGAEHGFAFSSGLGAATTLMHLLNPGDRVVAVADVYGGIYRMFSQVYGPKGYESEWVPAEELNESPAERFDERTRILWLETPTNPLLNIVDIRKAADAAHEAGAIVVG